MAENTKKKTAKKSDKSGAQEQEQTPRTAAVLDQDAALEQKYPMPELPGIENNRMWSVLIFAFGLLIALMAIIPGTAGWHRLHDFLLGMFGVAIFFVPVILIYTSVLIGLEKKQEVSGRAFWGFVLTFFASAVIQIFVVGKLPGEGFMGHVKALFQDGARLHGGGVASLVIGGPLLTVLGTTGAKIVAVLLFFVLILLLTGQGIIQFFEVITRPFRFLARCLSGFHSLIMGGDFMDGFNFEDGDDDDDEDGGIDPAFFAGHADDDILSADGQSEHEADLEALAIFDSGAAMAEVQLTDEEIRQNDQFSQMFDIPLPGENAGGSVPEPAKEPEKGQSQRSQELDELINRAAEKKSRSDAKAAGEDVPEEAPVQETPLYILPGLDLLSQPDVRSNSAEAAAEMRDKADTIVNTLKSFGVEVIIRNVYRGPAITRYEIQPGAGVKVSKIKGLEDDIALSLAAQGVRIEAPVPGKAAVGIEVPNINKDVVTIREILSSNEFRNSQSKLAFAVGKDITGNAIVGDIAKMPHVIIAGTTGSGKSVCTRSIIMSILYNARPDEVKMILIDPKVVEFKVFEGIPHLLIPIVTEAKKAAGALNWAVNEMMRRYNTFADVGANDLKSYNELAEDDGEMEPMAQIVIFIDELADMMLVAGKEVEDSICRLAQMGRAAGMHLVVATQRPTTDVITGLIKANIPSRIALSVMSQVDSRTIIDRAGADKLLGNGDMLYMPIGMNTPVRVQGCFASTKEINATLNFIKAQVQSEYDKDVIEAVESFVPQTKGDHDSADPGFEAGSDEDYVERAMEVAVNVGQLSTSMLQRKLKLGYARAARIMDELEELGVIGPSEGSKPRKVLMSKMQFDERKLRRMEGQ